MTLVVHSSRFTVSATELFAFHRDVRNLSTISPLIPRFELLSVPKLTEVGDRQSFRLSVGPFEATWEALVTKVETDRLIEDTQLSGPFLSWRHQHRMAEDGAGSRLTDAVSFRAIPTPAGEFLEYVFMRPGIKLMFRWRHRKTRAAFAAARCR